MILLDIFSLPKGMVCLDEQSVSQSRPHPFAVFVLLVSAGPGNVGGVILSCVLERQNSY